MKQCESCIFYDKEYDELLQSGDDVIVEGEDPYQEKHYCRGFNDGRDGGLIDSEIVEDKVECKERIPKN